MPFRPRHSNDHVVLGELEDLAVNGEAVQELLAAAVFAQDESSARADRDVVRRVQHGRARRLEQQRDRLGLRIVFPDLALADPAARRDDVDLLVVAVPAAFESRERRGAERPPLSPDEVAGHRVRVVVRRLDRHPLDIECRAVRIARAQVGVVGACDFQHVEEPAVGGTISFVRDVSIEARRGAVILGLVNEAGDRIDRQRLVRETAHVADRNGIAELVCRHVEDVAVRHRRKDRGLFARHPAAPRRRTAGAVSDRAAEAVGGLEQ